MPPRGIFKTCLFVWLTAFALAGEQSAALAVEKGSSDRVAILGASLSKGFGVQPGWTATVVASRAVEPEKVTEHANMFFFTNPAENGAALAAKTQEDGPTLVLAVDFLFWFGYGAIDVNGGKLASEDDRLRLLERGLTLLESFKCPLVIGDFPDASAAVGRIISPEQMPKAATLVALNERLRSWATARTNVIVLPLAEWMAQVRHGQPIRIGTHEFPKEATATWLQPDQLHPTAEGLQGLAMFVNERLIDRGFMEPGKALDSPSEIRLKVAAALREQRQKKAGEMLAYVRRQAEKHPEGSMDRLETLGEGLATLCRIYPEESSAAEELVRVLNELPIERAMLIAKRVNQATAPEIVRAKLRDILDPQPAPQTDTTEAGKRP